jgi:hypothetical protein
MSIYKYSSIQLPKNLEFLEILTYFENQTDILDVLKNLHENLYHLRLRIGWNCGIINTELKLFDNLPKNLK